MFVHKIIFMLCEILAKKFSICSSVDKDNHHLLTKCAFVFDMLRNCTINPQERCIGVGEGNPFEIDPYSKREKISPMLMQRHVKKL